MGSVVTNGVTVTSTDGLAHIISLSLGGAGGSWDHFSPSTVNVPAGGSATSTLTLPLPTPIDVCPGEPSPAPYYVLRYTVRGKEGTSVLASVSLEVLLVPPISYPFAVSIEPSKASYKVGETVSLAMNSNVRTDGVLTIRKPDGTTWHKQVVRLPGTFTKVAAQPIGTYTAELEAYFCGRALASASFSVTPDTYEVTISLAGLPTDVSTTLSVDGSKVADMKGGDVRVLTYPIGTSHTFQVDQYASGVAGYRYYCTSNTWTAAGEGSSVFNYATQVYLEVITDPAEVTDVTPSGWYALGSSASISSVPREVQRDKGTKYVFAEWKVDGTSRGAGEGLVVVMDAPHKVVAKFDTMFMLTIVSDYGNPKGAGYYKAGDTATFSVDSPIGIGIQQVFVEWKGDYTGKEPKGSLTMDGPKKITAVWTTSYFQLYIIIGVIAAIAVIGALLLWRRGRARPSAVKPPPTEPPTTPAETPSPTPDSATPSKRAVQVALRCTNCGHELEKGQIYCPECGQKRTD